MQPGDLRARIGFYSLQSQIDGYGNTESGYADDPDFECAANIRPRFGGEGVLAQRLTGTNLVNITVRQSSRTRNVDPSWKVKNERSGVEFNIRSVIDPLEHTLQRGAWFELLCEKGAALTISVPIDLGPGADTALKRSGAFDIALPWRPIQPAPDGTIDAGDRQIAAKLYP